MTGRDGSALVAASVAVLVAGIVLLAAVHVGVLLRTSAIAAAAADHAALAAAATLADPSRDPARAAARVADGFGARVTSCACSALPVRVDVAVPVPEELDLLARVVGPDLTASGHARLVPLESQCSLKSASCSPAPEAPSPNTRGRGVTAPSSTWRTRQHRGHLDPLTRRGPGSRLGSPVAPGALHPPTNPPISQALGRLGSPVATGAPYPTTDGTLAVSGWLGQRSAP